MQVGKSTITFVRPSKWVVTDFDGTNPEPDPRPYWSWEYISFFGNRGFYLRIAGMEATVEL